MENEIWKPVKGYEGIYEVSSLGRVRKVETGLILHQSNYGGGYRQVGLRKDGKGKTISVHRLVAKAFLPNPDMLPQINHRDENKANNCVENLEWCDGSYNMRYNDLQLRIREKSVTRHALDVKRLENGHILSKLRKTKEWTLHEAAAKIGISGSTLTRIESGVTSVSFDTLESLANLYGYTLTITKKEDDRGPDRPQTGNIAPLKRMTPPIKGALGEAVESKSIVAFDIMEQLKREMKERMERNGNDLDKTAAEMGISKRTLNRKLKKLGLI